MFWGLIKDLNQYVHFLSIIDYEKIVELLAHKSANSDEINGNDTTAILLSGSEGNLGIYLCERFENTFYLIKLYPFLELTNTIELLVQRGPIDTRNSKNNSAILLAALKGFFFGTKIKITLYISKTKLETSTLFFKLKLRSKKHFVTVLLGNGKVVEYFIRKGADVTVKNVHKTNVLMAASNFGLTTAIELLLKHGAIDEINAINEDNSSALVRINLHLSLIKFIWNLELLFHVT